MRSIKVFAIKMSTAVLYTFFLWTFFVDGDLEVDEGNGIAFKFCQ